jgi:hypothetical protein
MTQQAQPALSNHYIQELMTIGPFKGIDATTAPIYVDPDHAVDALNIVPDRAYSGYVTAQGRSDLGVTGLPSTVGDPDSLIKCLDATGVYYLAYYPELSQIWFFRPGGAATSLTLPAGAILTGKAQFVQGGYWTFLSTTIQTDTPLKIKYDTHTVTMWGIIAPTTALSSAASGSGALNFADYQWVVTYGVTAGGVSIQESSAGPSSAPLALVNQNAALSAIPISPDPQVNERNIYRLDSSGAYRLVYSIPDNTTTTYTDTTADANVTGQNLLTRDPPTSANCACYHKDYMCLFGVPTSNPSTSSDIYWANPTEPWGFNYATQEFPADENLGNDVAVAMTSTSALGFMLKTRTAFGLFGDSTNDFYVQKLFDIGCISKKSVIVAQGVTFWCSAEGVYAFDGSDAPQYLSRNIKSFLEANRALLSTTVGAYKDRCYFLSFPTLSITWMYDTVNQEWWKLGWATGVFYFDPDDVSVTPGAIIGGSQTGLMDQWFSAETDLTNPITSTYTSRIADAGVPEATKVARKAAIIAPPQAAIATLTITADPGPAQKQAIRTVDLLTTTSQAQIISIPPGIEGREFQLMLSVVSSQQVQIQKIVLYGYVRRRLSSR